MLLVEIVAPLLVALLVAYGGLAYRHGLPSPFASKHDRALVHIRQLEHELGIDYAQPDAVPALPDDVLRDAYRADVRVRFEHSTTAPVNYVQLARGYDGPALTDADVRRLEHGDE